MYELPRGLAAACNNSLCVQMLSVCRGMFQPHSINARHYLEPRNVCDVIIIAFMQRLLLVLNGPHRRQ
jgi:hypothetical protein